MFKKYCIMNKSLIASNIFISEHRVPSRVFCSLMSLTPLHQGDIFNLFFLQVFSLYVVTRSKFYYYSFETDTCIYFLSWPKMNDVHLRIIHCFIQNPSHPVASIALTVDGLI